MHLGRELIKSRLRGKGGAKGGVETLSRGLLPEAQGGAGQVPHEPLQLVAACLPPRLDQVPQAVVQPP